jgi:hypothetical protein
MIEQYRSVRQDQMMDTLMGCAVIMLWKEVFARQPEKFEELVTCWKPAATEAAIDRLREVGGLDQYADVLRGMIQDDVIEVAANARNLMTE